MDELSLVFLFIIAGILLGVACKAMTATEEEKADAAKAAESPSQPSTGSSEVPPAAPDDANTKDCKSCGGHSQAGRLCSFCGRVL